MFRRDGTKIVMPKGAPRKQRPRVRRRAIAHSGGYDERIVWLRGR